MSAPASIWVTHDRMYGVTITHRSKGDALRERDRDPRFIEVIEYVPRRPAGKDGG